MWLIYAGTAVISSTILATIFRISAVKTTNPRAFSFVMNSSILILALLISVFAGIGKIHLDPYLLYLIILSTLGYGVFQRYQFVARKHLESSVTQTIMTPGSIAGYILAIIWLGETPSLIRVVGYVLILASTILVVLRPGTKLKVNKYALLAFAISVALNLSIIINKRVSSSFENILTYIVIILAVQVLFTYFPRVSLSEIKREVSSQKGFLLALAILNLVAIFSSISAIKLAPATYVTPVLASNVVFIAIAGIIFLKERERVVIKLLAATIATAGLLLIGR